MTSQPNLPQVHQPKARKSRRSFSVGAKILGIVGLCLALMAAGDGFAIWQMHKIGSEIEGLAERDVPLTNALTQATVHQLGQALSLERAMRAAEVMVVYPDAREEFEASAKLFEALNAKVDKQIAGAKKMMALAHETASTDKERTLFKSLGDEIAKLGPEHKAFHGHAAEIIGLLRAGRTETARDKFAAVEKGGEQLNHAVEAILMRVEKLTQEAAVTAQAHEQFAFRMIIALALLTLVLGLVLAIIFVRRNIARPLSEINDGLNALANGDMSVDVKAYSNDEIGAVAKAFGSFKTATRRAKELEAEQQEAKRRSEEDRRQQMEELADSFDSSVGLIIETVASTAAELNTSAQSLASISEETSSQATCVASASEEATSNVQAVAAASEEMSSSINEINRKVTEASTVTGQAVETVKLTCEQMADLANGADKIGEVINLISGIAEQTNLLALNATIESARAGEAGKGFAVVAAEVKELAQETGKATDEIAAQIQGIQAATRQAAGSMESIGDIINKINEIATAVAAAMEEQGQTTQEIASNVHEAAAGTGEVTRNITGVTQASQEAGSASGQVLEVATELSRKSEELKSEVACFLKGVRAA